MREEKPAMLKAKMSPHFTSRLSYIHKMMMALHNRIWLLHLLAKHCRSPKSLKKSSFSYINAILPLCIIIEINIMITGSFYADCSASSNSHHFCMKYDSDPHKKSVSIANTLRSWIVWRGAESGYAQNLISVSGAESLESFALPRTKKVHGNVNNFFAGNLPTNRRQWPYFWRILLRNRVCLD